MIGQLIDIPTEVENKKMEELFLSIYFNDVEKVIEFKNKFPELYAKKHQFKIDENTTFNLINLTFFNQTIWFDGDWVDVIKLLVENNRQKTKKMIAFWSNELEQEKIHREIEYNQYYEHFSCHDPNDYEQIIIDPIAFYLENGFREIDLKLYNRAKCFDFAAVKELLELGAKPDIHFDNDGDSSTFSVILNQISYLATCELIPEFEVFETKGYNQNFNIKRMFGYILGLAAHEEMYYLLENYKNDIK